jgi:formiminotetrahydrofolate cyclodeaminase
MPEFLAALGSSAPTPGGGAASALAGALCAALTEMVAQLTAGRARFAQVDGPMRAVIAQAQRIRADLLALMDEDERAYAAVSAAYKLPKTSEDERARRDDAVQAALRSAMQPPLRVMERACSAMELASEVAASGNPSVVSDAGCAALLGETAVRAAALNVLANVVLMRDQDVAIQAREAASTFEERAKGLRERTLAAVHARMGA